MQIQQKYVLGFLFSANRQRVVLVKKKPNIPRLEFMGGLLNGVGGKVNALEPNIDAMNRHFTKETGIIINNNPGWEMFLQLSIDGSKDYGGDLIICYRCFTKELPLAESIISQPDEPVSIYSVWELNKKNKYMTVPNLKWMIRMAMDTDITSSFVTSK